MDTQRFCEALKESQFSVAMSASTLARFAELAELRCYSAGQIVFREGSVNQEFFIIDRGRVALEMNVPARGDVRILTLGPGDLLAWSAVIGEGRMTASAIALSDVEVIAASAPALQALCKSDPEFASQLMHGVAIALSKRLIATRLQLLDLFAHEPRPGLS